MTVVTLSASCQWLTAFDLEPEAEVTQLLCEDERDNDFDGFVDCQESSCAGFARCCDIPEVLLEDAFDGPACDQSECTNAACGELQCGPSDAWITWPCPFPKVCDGALRLDKQACYAQGILSSERLPVRPGLSVDVDLVGAPESLGYLEVALTVQEPEEFPGALDECSAFQFVRGFAALRQERSGDGYELIAYFQGTEIGRSRAIADPDVAHTASMRIDIDGGLLFELDGELIASASVPVPDGSVDARLAISGLTRTVAVDHVRVEAGLRCDAPARWRLAGSSLDESLALAPASGAVFDSSEVFYPSVASTPAGLELLYMGCSWGQGQNACDVEAVSLGRAVGQTGRDFVRVDTAPVLRARDVFPSSAIFDHYIWSAELPREREGMTLIGGVSIFASRGLEPPRLEEVFPKAGAAGEYICCPSAAVGPDGRTYLYYAGRATSSARWSIGLATPGADGSFVRHPGSPVLGGSTSSDSAGSSHPAVVYDEERQMFRMWYEATDFFGRAGIGYATSVDGIDWQPFEHNPVLRAEDIGLSSIGAPSVILTADRRLLMWVDGTLPDRPGRHIFMLENDGARIEELGE